jgi:pilus assembly protein Flp/PilA
VKEGLFMKWTHLSKNCSDERGQGLVEYALILVLVAIVVIAILLQLGPTVGQVYCTIANALQPGSCGPIVSVSASRQNPNLVKVTVQVSETTEISVSMVSGNGSVANSPQTCNTSCTFNITGATGSGSAKAQASDVEMSVNWN